MPFVFLGDGQGLQYSSLELWLGFGSTVSVVLYSVCCSIIFGDRKGLFVYIIIFLKYEHREESKGRTWWVQ